MPPKTEKKAKKKKAATPKVRSSASARIAQAINLNFLEGKPARARTSVRQTKLATVPPRVLARLRIEAEARAEQLIRNEQKNLAAMLREQKAAGQISAAEAKTLRAQGELLIEKEAAKKVEQELRKQLADVDTGSLENVRHKQEMELAAIKKKTPIKVKTEKIKEEKLEVEEAHTGDGTLEGLIKNYGLDRDQLKERLEQLRKDKRLPRVLLSQFKRDLKAIESKVDRLQTPETKTQTQAVINVLGDAFGALDSLYSRVEQAQTEIADSPEESAETQLMEENEQLLELLQRQDRQNEELSDDLRKSTEKETARVLEAFDRATDMPPSFDEAKGSIKKENLDEKLEGAGEDSDGLYESSETEEEVSAADESSEGDESINGSGAYLAQNSNSQVRSPPRRPLHIR